MSTNRLLSFALLAVLIQTAFATALIAVFARAFALPIVLGNAALLCLTTNLLGGLWALRQRFDARPSGRPSVSAALVPLASCFVFLALRLVIGPREPALVTLAALALVAPLGHRAWSEWIAREPPSPYVAAIPPILGVGLAAAVVAPAALGIALLLASAFGAALALRSCRRSKAGRDEEKPAVVAQPSSERALERTIADAGAMRARFMAAMSHDLKSPLNSILGFGQVLESEVDGALTPGQRESVDMILDAARQLLLLLTDILDLARLEAGKLTLDRHWTPSVEILTEAIEQARTFVEGRQVQIEAELQPGLPPVYVDKPRIVQAVVGLFRNAAPSLVKTTIRLRARIASGPPGPPRHLCVEIHDALGAISQQSLERIFEAFRDIGSIHVRRLGGLGMALSLARGLVRLHGGEVWAARSSEAGTVLSVAIPLDGPAKVSRRRSPRELRAVSRGER